MTATVVEHVADLRGGALAALNCRDTEIIIDGPAGTGKSYGALHKLHLIALANPGAKLLAVRKTAVSFTSTGLVTYREHVAKDAIRHGLVRWYGGSKSEAAQFVYRNGSRFVVGGMDNPLKIMSSDYDFIFVQEATELTLTDWESLLTRLRNGVVSFQQILGDLNPGHPSHWLHARANEGKVRRFLSRHRDNPALFGPDGAPTERGAAYMSVLDNLTGVRRLRLRDGVWAAAEGVIYESWDPARHIVAREIPKDWPRVWSVDFGHTNPFVCQCWATDPDGRLWLVWEYVRTRTIVEDHARELKKLAESDGAPLYIIADHDAEDQATLRRHLPWSIRNAKKTVKGGIDAVEERLKAGRLLVRAGALMDRDPHMVEGVLPIGLVEEIGGYVWLPPVEGRAAKDEPQKLNDHSMDAMRYRVADADLASRFRIFTSEDD